MDWKTTRLLELAGLKRRRTPDHLLTEGEDEGGDDMFDDAGDDAGGDDLFGDDTEGDEGGEEGGGEGEADENNRIPPKELSARDIEKYGSPRFNEIQDDLVAMFNASMESGGTAAQEMEISPGTPITDPEEVDEETPAKEEPEDDAGDEGEDDEEANESFYRYGNRRDKWLINEATRLLFEAEEEGAAADEFDMENFAREVANYMENIHNTQKIEGGIFNSARQMILNNFGEDTEKEFIEMLASIDKKWDFTGIKAEVEFTAPIAVGGSGEAAGA